MYKMSFLDYYTIVMERYEARKPGEALPINHQYIQCLYEAQTISLSDRDDLIRANQMAYNAYTKYPKEI